MLVLYKHTQEHAHTKKRRMKKQRPRFFLYNMYIVSRWRKKKKKGKEKEEKKCVCSPAYISMLTGVPHDARLLLPVPQLPSGLRAGKKHHIPTVRDSELLYYYI